MAIKRVHTGGITDAWSNEGNLNAPIKGFESRKTRKAKKGFTSIVGEDEDEGDDIWEV